MKDIKVFISSTFSDLEAERNKIMLAFREAEKYAIENYINLKTIDFRWGLPDGAHVMKSCLESISISRPYFLCILGGNYGSQPNWDDYEKEKEYLSEYNQFIEDNVFKSKPENNLSYTAMEVYFALSQEYGKDNARFLHLVYKNDTDSRQEALIEYIKNKGYSPVECSSPDELVKEVSLYLTSIINRNSLIEIDNKDNDNAQKYIFGGFNRINTQSRQLNLYRKSQEYLLNSLLKDSFSREQENLLEDFVDSSSTICCIEGKDGVGKSTLVARWLNNRINKNDSSEISIYHFCQGGYTDDIFEHFYLELAEINNHPLEDYYAELFSTSEYFPNSTSIFKESLKQLESDKRILIVLDGLENMNEVFLPGFFDLFSNTNNNIKLILTTGISPKYSLDCKIIQLPYLKGDETKHIITNYLKNHNKTDIVSNKIAEVLVLNPMLHNPKLLSSVLYDIRAFANHDNIKDKVSEYQKASNANAIYSIIINNWKKIIPSIEDNNVLAWIAYSHFGLAEEEIKNVAGYIGNKEYLWHQFFSFVEPYIEWNGERIQFSNKWLKEAIVKDNLEKEEDIKNLMINYLQHNCVLIEKQFDELPYLLKETNRYDELLSYILDLSVFQYANKTHKKRGVLKDLWSYFELSDFSNYLNSPHKDMNQTDYIELLNDLCDFLYFNWVEMFPDEDNFDIELLHFSICKKIIHELGNNTTKKIDPHKLANAYKTVAVAYIDSFKLKKAQKLLDKGITLLKPIVEEKYKFYEKTKKLYKMPKILDDIDKITKSYVESVKRTDFLKVLNPYIDLLVEMFNTNPRVRKAKKLYKEVQGWIDKLDQTKDESRNTSLLRSTVEYGYGMILYNANMYMNAFEKFNNAFKLKYQYLLQVEHYRRDMYQERRLMETYKMIEACQIEGDSELYNDQYLYVEAVEKYGEEHLDILHYCKCLFNYAATLYYQTIGNENVDTIPLLKKAEIYYDKVISLAEDGQLHEMFIRASFFKMECLANMEKGEDIPTICTSILKREKRLGENERNDAFINQILTICHSINDE